MAVAGRPTECLHTSSYLNCIHNEMWPNYLPKSSAYIPLFLVLRFIRTTAIAFKSDFSSVNVRYSTVRLFFIFCLSTRISLAYQYNKWNKRNTSQHSFNSLLYTHTPDYSVWREAGEERNTQRKKSISLAM